MNLFAPKLKPGDEVRVISPARSLALISKQTRDIANKRFKELGLKLTFGAHAEECDDFMSSSVESRVKDLHDAFADPNVKGVMTVLGGFNSNQLLPYIDWQIIKNNPKVFCGFSDITVLNNAILAKTGLVNYSGPHYSSFGMEAYFEYCLEYFKKCLMSDDPINVKPSKVWTDDLWFLDQAKRDPIKNEGWLPINPGMATGTIIGGNLNTLNLLQGTPFMPSLNDAIAFIEVTGDLQAHHFDRLLVSLIQQPDFKNVKGIVIGRFQKDSKMTAQVLTEIIKSKKELGHLPVLAGVDFGHTNQIITFPVGGRVELTVAGENSKLIIENH